MPASCGDAWRLLEGRAAYAAPHPLAMALLSKPTLQPINAASAPLKSDRVAVKLRNTMPLVLATRSASRAVGEFMASFASCYTVASAGNAPPDVKSPFVTVVMPTVGPATPPPGQPFLSAANKGFCGPLCKPAPHSPHPRPRPRRPLRRACPAPHVRNKDGSEPGRRHGRRRRQGRSGHRRQGEHAVRRRGARARQARDPRRGARAVRGCR